MYFILDGVKTKYINSGLGSIEKKFVQMSIRGYKFQIILDSDFRILTIILQLVLYKRHIGFGENLF